MEYGVGGAGGCERGGVVEYSRGEESGCRCGAEGVGSFPIWDKDNFWKL